MKEHTGLPVAGYQPQSDDKVTLVNANKELEERVLRQIESIKNDPRYDGRMAQIAFTKTQEAFMWLNRAVFQPSRISLPGDNEGNGE